MALTAINQERPTAIAPMPPPTTEQKIEQHLEEATTPLTIAALRKLCRTRNATLTASLSALVAAGRIRKGAAGYALTR